MMVLFLDFDGVLHPLPYGAEGPFSRLPMVETWLRQRPGVEVVISSSWKEAHPFDELKDLFPVDLQQRILGCTPYYGEMLGCSTWQQLEREREVALYQREAECRRWLHNTNRISQPWAALDDIPEFFTPGLRELVVCDQATGVTESQLAALDRVFGADGR